MFTWQHEQGESIWITQAETIRNSDTSSILAVLHLQANNTKDDLYIRFRYRRGTRSVLPTCKRIRFGIILCFVQNWFFLGSGSRFLKDSGSVHHLITIQIIEWYLPGTLMQLAIGQQGALTHVTFSLSHICPREHGELKQGSTQGVSSENVIIKCYYSFNFI